jgi:hypothetical protein
MLRGDGEVIPLLQSRGKVSLSILIAALVAIACLVACIAMVTVGQRPTVLEARIATARAARMQGHLARAQKLVDVSSSTTTMPHISEKFLNSK